MSWTFCALCLASSLFLSNSGRRPTWIEMELHSGCWLQRDLVVWNLKIHMNSCSHRSTFKKSWLQVNYFQAFPPSTKMKGRRGERSRRLCHVQWCTWTPRGWNLTIILSQSVQTPPLCLLEHPVSKPYPWKINKKLNWLGRSIYCTQYAVALPIGFDDHLLKMLTIWELSLLAAAFCFIAP